MLTNLRRKLGMVPPPPVGEGVLAPYIDPQVQQGVPTALTTEEHGIAVQVNDLGAIPVWLREQVRRLPALQFFSHRCFRRVSTTLACRSTDRMAFF